MPEANKLNVCNYSAYKRARQLLEQDYVRILAESGIDRSWLVRHFLSTTSPEHLKLGISHHVIIWKARAITTEWTPDMI